MSAPMQQLPERLRVAATAIAKARGARVGLSADEVALEVLASSMLDDVLEDARAALAAVDDHEAAILADPHHPDAVGIADVERLAAAIDAGTIAFLVRDRLGRARAVLWGRAAEAALVTGEPAQALWSGLAGAVRMLAESEPAGDPERRP